MSDPERLRDSLGAGFERSLLEAATEAGVPAPARQLALSHALAAVGGLGAAAGAAHAATHGAHAATSGGSALAAGVVKAFAIGLASGALVAGGALGVQQLVGHRAPPARQVAPSPVPRPATAPTSARTQPAPSAAPPATPALHPAPARAVAAMPSASAASPASQLAEQVALLDRARSLLSDGDARAALAVLDKYSTRFPRGALAPEATVLRVEALARSGDRAGASALARTFLTRHPGGPLAERARRYLEP